MITLLHYTRWTGGSRVSAAPRLSHRLSVADDDRRTLWDNNRRTVTIRIEWKIFYRGTQWWDEWSRCRLSAGVHGTARRDTNPRGDQTSTQHPSLRRICSWKLTHAEIYGWHLEAKTRSVCIGDRLDRSLGVLELLENEFRRGPIWPA